MKQPTIRATDAALIRIEQVRANRKQPDAGVRIAITGRSNGEFVYDLALVFAGQERDGDLMVDGSQGVTFHTPLASAPYLDGVTLDFDRPSGALTVQNPNPLWLDPVAERVQSFLDAEINPMVAGHGGHIDLLDVADGKAYIHMGGACQYAARLGRNHQRLANELERGIHRLGFLPIQAHPGCPALRP